jgi:AhpD family alkylhydroperoxidase
LAVSAINGCGTCIEAHGLVVRKAAQIASVVHIVATALDAEEALVGKDFTATA